MVLYNLFIYYLSFNHLWLNREDTKSILKKYSPQQINDHLFCTVGINNYVKTIILLQDEKKNRHGIIQFRNDYNMNLLVCTESETINVDSFLWVEKEQSSVKDFLKYLSYHSMKKITYSKDLDEKDKLHFS